MSNKSGLSEFCQIFCCPPCPGKIVSKLAFRPPQPTYKIVTNRNGDCSLELTDKTEWPYSDREKSFIEAFYVHTSRRNKIACFYITCSSNAKFTLLYSHGNAVDLGQMCSVYLSLGSRINCNILGYDYSGYGVSNGKPSEKNLYADIRAAWGALKNKYGIPSENVILYGQSLGTVPTIDLASRYKFGAVILHSALTSGMRVAFPNLTRTWFFDAFPSIDKVKKVNSPTLIIHGTEDDVIDFTHGLKLFELCPAAVEPLWVIGAGHNDIELHTVYISRLKRFVTFELPYYSSL